MTYIYESLDGQNGAKFERKIKINKKNLFAFSVVEASEARRQPGVRKSRGIALEGLAEGENLGRRRRREVESLRSVNNGSRRGWCAGVDRS